MYANPPSYIPPIPCSLKVSCFTSPELRSFNRTASKKFSTALNRRTALCLPRGRYGQATDRDRATARKPLTLVDHFDIKHQVSDAFYGCERCERHFSNFCLDKITLLFKNSCKNLLLKGKAGRENWRRRECHQSEPRRPGDGVSGRTPRRRARARMRGGDSGPLFCCCLSCCFCGGLETTVVL